MSEKRALTEAQWLSDSTGMVWMLDHLRDHGKATRTKVGKRKLRLFACGCCRLLWERLTEPKLRHAVLIAERFAEGDADEEDMAAARRGAVRLTFRQDSDVTERALVSMAAHTTAAHPYWVAREVTVLPFVHGGPCVDVASAEALLRDLLRCVFGNPFRPLGRRKLPAHVVGLAQECYAAFPPVSDQFLLLADALADLGEDEAAAHCREGRHLKGCHVIDWATGRG